MVDEVEAAAGDFAALIANGDYEPEPFVGGGTTGKAPARILGIDCVDNSEDSVALAFTAKYGGTLRFDHDAGSWFQWNGMRWLKLSVPVAFQYARQMARNLANGKAGMCKAAVAGGVERFAKSDPVHAVTADAWDAHTMLLGTPGGTINLLSGKMKRPDPADGITLSTGCEPNSGEPALWLKFLHEACAGDAEMVTYLQRICGYCLTGDTREHALFFVHGSGGNGKSVFLNLVTFILGDYAKNAAMDTFTASKYDKHTTDLAMLKGARGVFASETEEGRAWAEARIKALTGGDQITARFMRQDNFTFTPQFKLVVVGNHAPKLHNVDEAMRRRFNIIPFITKPAEPDRKLEEKLREEAPRILGWMVRGCLDWQQHGLGRPEAVRLATEEYFSNQDMFGQWLAERTVGDPGSTREFTPTKDLFPDWQRFANDAGEYPGDLKSFVPKLEQRGYRKARGAVSDGKPMGFRGIKLIFTQ